MKAAFGLKAHSGWAILVVLGVAGPRVEVVDRRRLDLVGDGEPWVKAPYHAAERRGRGDARAMVQSATASARRSAVKELQAALDRATAAGHAVAACAVLVTAPMPAWTVEEILAVHFRMHKAEGTLFREALARAAGRCGLGVVEVLEKELDAEAERALGAGMEVLRGRVTALGKMLGPPWGKDQKDAALAAMIALRRPRGATLGEP